jgi:hypothetical protein
VVGKLDPCAKKDSKTPRCTKKCISGYNVTYEKDKHYGRLFFPILCIGPFLAFMSFGLFWE